MMIVHIVPCPQSGCVAYIRVVDGMPAGEYPCICRAVKVRLSWAPYQERDDPPRLELAKKPEEPTP